MIVFDLECSGAQHRFEGWFKSSDDFTRQQERGLVSCPHCGSVEVAKAVQAPRLTRKGNQLPEVSRPPSPRPTPAPAAPVAHSPLPAQAAQVMQALGRMQAELLKTSRDAGDRFVEDARAMHYGERDAETIYGRATLVEAKELLEEGIAVMPLPFPVVPPEQAN